MIVTLGIAIYVGEGKCDIYVHLLNQYVVLCGILVLPIITYVTLKWFVCFLFIIPPMSQGFFLHVCPLKYHFVM